MTADSACIVWMSPVFLSFFFIIVKTGDLFIEIKNNIFFHSYIDCLCIFTSKTTNSGKTHQVNDTCLHSHEAIYVGVVGAWK